LRARHTDRDAGVDHCSKATVKDPIVTVTALVKSYRGAHVRALDGVDLAVPEGSFFGLLGPNAAGKTTLISILCGILAPDSGLLRIRSASGALLDPRAARACVGLVPQDLAFYPTLNFVENLRFFGAMHGLRGKSLAKRIDACVALGRLESVMLQRSETLSGGLKRRLNFALGMLHAPRVLVLDEPTAGMDTQSRYFLREELQRLNAEGTTIIYTSHYLEEVEQLCDHMAIIDHGKVIAQGTLAEMLAQIPSVVTASSGPRDLQSLYFQLTGTRLRDGHDAAHAPL
jgi:ABC-2 type transport system ATP-binding protein